MDEGKYILIKQFLFLPSRPNRKINNRSKIACEIAIAKASLKIFFFFSSQIGMYGTEQQPTIPLGC